VIKSATNPREPRATSFESPEDVALDKFVSYKLGIPVRPGMRLSVRLNLVDENPLNPRAFIIEDDLRDFAENLRANGQLLPALAYFNSQTGRFLLKEGHRRRRGLLLASRPDILLEVLAPATDRLQAFKEARISNTQRRSHTAYDDAVRFRELLEQGLVREQADLAPTFDVNESYVSKVLSLGEMPRTLLEKMVAHESLFGIATGYALGQYYRRKGEGATHRLIERIVAGKLTTRQVEQLVRGGDESALTRVNEPQRRARALSRATITGGATGELKAFENGQLKLDVNGLSDEKRDLLFARVLTAFEEIDVTYRAPSRANAEPRDLRR
jgi:ParB family transcriptional regulator, chromosome partitioning protein